MFAQVCKAYTKFHADTKNEGGSWNIPCNGRTNLNIECTVIGMVVHYAKTYVSIVLFVDAEQDTYQEQMAIWGSTRKDIYTAVFRNLKKNGQLHCIQHRGWSRARRALVQVCHMNRSEVISWGQHKFKVKVDKVNGSYSCECREWEHTCIVERH